MAQDSTRGPPLEGELLPGGVYDRAAVDARRRAMADPSASPRQPYHYGADDPRLNGRQRIDRVPDVVMVRHRSLASRLAIAFLEGLRVRSLWVTDRILETLIKVLRIAVYVVVLPALATIALLSWERAQEANDAAGAARVAGETAATTVTGFIGGFWDSITGAADPAPASVSGAPARKDQADDKAVANPMR